MLGWSIIASACRSASNRAMTWRVSMPGLMIFRATLRRTGSSLLGHVDDAHAPFADLLEQLVRADDRAGAFHRLGWGETTVGPAAGESRKLPILGWRSRSRSTLRRRSGSEPHTSSR